MGGKAAYRQFLQGAKAPTLPVARALTMKARNLRRTRQYSLVRKAQGIFVTGLETIDLVAFSVVNFPLFWAIRKKDFEIIIEHRVTYAAECLSCRQNNNILVSAVRYVN